MTIPTKRKPVSYRRRDGTKGTRKAPGPRTHKDLDEDTAQHLPCKRKQYMVWDKGVKGLHVLVNPKGARTYRSLYYYPGSRRPHSRSLGRIGVMALEEARQLCLADQKLARKGADPKRDEPSRSDRFEDVVNEYVDREQIARKQNVTAEEARRILLREFAAFKDRPIGLIGGHEIENVLERIRDGDADYRGRPYLANAAWGHLKTMFKWAAKKGKVAASPMLTIDRPWNGAKPRDRWFCDDELKKLWDCNLDRYESAFLKLLILTGKRRGALASMRWGEINDAWLWTPPPGAKNKRKHPLPLPKLAQRILLGLKPENAKPDDYVFPPPKGGPRGKLHVDPGFEQSVRRLSGIADFFPHAIRHTVETRLAEFRIKLPNGRSIPAVPRDLRDLLLDHAPSRGAGKDYDHHTYETEMREAIELWADHIEQLVMPEGVKALR